MGLSLYLEKQEETASSCVYTFGPSDTSVGRVVLDKETGDIELQTLDSTSEGPSEKYYLAQAVSRLQEYQEQHRYPASDEWEV